MSPIQRQGRRKANVPYDSAWDKWFAEEHNGSPVEWWVVQMSVLDEQFTTILPTRPAKYFTLEEDDEYEILLRFEASSYAEAYDRLQEFRTP